MTNRATIARITGALEQLDRTRFQCGRAPDSIEGASLRIVYDICKRASEPLTIDGFHGARVPLIALAHAIRAGAIEAFEVQP